VTGKICIYLLDKDVKGFVSKIQELKAAQSERVRLITVYCCREARLAKSVFYNRTAVQKFP